MRKLPSTAFKKGQIAHNAGLRKEAKLRGDLRYFTGKPCKHGHVAERHVSNGMCLECAKIKTNNQRQKETPEQTKVRLEKSAQRVALWRKHNPDHLERHKQCKIKYKKSLEGLAKNRNHLAKRRAALLERTISEDVDDLWVIEEIYHLAALRTQMFGFQWHVDHIVPLQGETVSGLHVPKNLRVIPWLENVKKGNKYLEAERG
jgi:hypothetical protein